MTEPRPTPEAPEIERETRRIGKVALYAFLSNLVLAAMKGGLAYFSNSLAVTAGAIDSATDAVASLVLLAGLKISRKRGPASH